MSELVKGALETDALIIGVEPNLLGIFSGGVLPHIAVPDAPNNALYCHVDGRVFKLNGLGSVATSWVVQTDNSGSIPFCNADGTEDNIDLINGEIPFQNADGTDDNIGLV